MFFFIFCVFKGVKVRFLVLWRLELVLIYVIEFDFYIKVVIFLGSFYFVVIKYIKLVSYFGF